ARASTAATEDELETLLVRASTIAPEFRELAGIDVAVDAGPAGRYDIPALAFDGTEFPRLDPGPKIAQIVELDELIDVFSKVLGGPHREGRRGGGAGWRFPPVRPAACRFRHAHEAVAETRCGATRTPRQHRSFRPILRLGTVARSLRIGPLVDRSPGR